MSKGSVEHEVKDGVAVEVAQALLEWGEFNFRVVDPRLTVREVAGKIKGTSRWGSWTVEIDERGRPACISFVVKEGPKKAYLTFNLNRRSYQPQLRLITHIEGQIEETSLIQVGIDNIDYRIRSVGGDRGVLIIELGSSEAVRGKAVINSSAHVYYQHGFPQ